MNNPCKVAILYICTGKYVAFWEGFYHSFEKFFLEQAEIEYFVFTDAPKLYAEDENDRIHRIPQENLGWPGNTLFRFRMFNRIKEITNSFDYMFFFNANVRCVQKITEEEFLPIEQDLLVVEHPGFYRTNIWKLPYERSKKSGARIPYGKGKHYVYGAVNGGKTKPYLAMCQKLEADIESDYAKGVIAKWHDESHLNCYIWQHENYKILSPAYAYPENYKLPFEAKIQTLDKASVIELDKEKLEELDARSLKKRILKKIKAES